VLPNPPALGRRERAKLDKRRRIEEAARAVFSQRGYASATIREIAEHADVAIGTLFVYAKDKRDLLMMIVNDELDALSATERAQVRRSRDLVGDLVAFLRPRYTYWARDPDLARAAMREMNAPYVESPDLGLELLRGQRRRQQIVVAIAHIVRARYRAAGHALEDDPDTIAWLFADIYLSEVRLWLNDAHPTVESGLRRLRALFELAVHGLPEAVR
jgi:AcrR family transcriptional regulator